MELKRQRRDQEAEEAQEMEKLRRLRWEIKDLDSKVNKEREDLQEAKDRWAVYLPKEEKAKQEAYTMRKLKEELYERKRKELADAKKERIANTEIAEFFVKEREKDKKRKKRAKTKGRTGSKVRPRQKSSVEGDRAGPSQPSPFSTIA